VRVSNFLSRFTPKTEAKGTLASPDASLFEVFGVQPVSSGVNVSPRNAMEVPSVRAAVEAISETIGQLGFPVYAVGSDGAKSLDTAHPVSKLLNNEANPWTPAARFRSQLTRDACLFGNGFAFVNVVNGKPIELLRLHPDAVSVQYDLSTGEPIYRVSGDPAVPASKGTITPRDRIFHLPAPSIDGIVGASPVMLGREAIGLARALETHGARLFRNGARPGGVLSFKSPLTPEGLAKAKAAWQAAHGGDRSGGTAVMDGDAEFTALTLTSVDAQYLELCHFSCEQIGRIWRVPPVLIGEYGRATWGNATEMARQFHDYCLKFWMRNWEGEVRLKLFGAEERDNYLAEHDTDDLLLPDLATRAKAYNQLIAARVLNPNEARELERRAPYAGGEKFESFKLTPAGSVGNDNGAAPGAAA
jgi:HK97 family phage portal protein